ncbi:MAG: hypothetical protein IKI41_03700 [Clostridia bacterium]|nr:hypothetical protein [Clostridia bacterium]
MKSVEIFRLFGDYFNTRGFKKKGSMVYRINDYISLCLFFECTNTGSVYFDYSFFPIIMSSCFFHYTYGGRLQDISPGRHTSLTVPYETEESIQKWVQIVKDAVDSRLIPFYQMIEDPKTLLNYLYSNEKDNIISCSFVDRIMLTAYLEVYIGEKPKKILSFLEYSKDCLLHSPKVQISEKGRLIKIEELDVLASLTKGTEVEKDCFFNNIKNDMREKHFGLERIYNL